MASLPPFPWPPNGDGELFSLHYSFPISLQLCPTPPHFVLFFCPHSSFCVPNDNQILVTGLLDFCGAQFLSKVALSNVRERDWHSSVALMWKYGPCPSRQINYAQSYACPFSWILLFVFSLLWIPTGLILFVLWKVEFFYFLLCMTSP